MVFFAKKISVCNLLAFLFIFVVAFPQLADCAVIANYRLDECRWNGSHDEVKDSSVNNLHGTAFNDANTVINDGVGGLCNMGRFDGSGDYVEVADSSVLNPAGAFTASVWFRADSLGTWNGVISKLTDVNPGTGRGWNIQVGSSQRIASLMADDTGHYVYLRSTTVPQTGVWYHVVLVHQADNTNHLYINGHEEATNNHGIAFTTNPFQIGKFYTNSTGLVFDGAIDEVELFDTALDAGEIQILYSNLQAQQNSDGSNRYCSCANAIGEYHFNEAIWNGNPGGVRDSSSGHYHATAVNGAVTEELSPAIPGSPGTCNYGVFDGVDDYVALPSNYPDLTTDFTVTAWIRTTDNTRSGQRILIDDPNNTQGFGFSLGDGGTGTIRFFSRSTSPIILDTPRVIENDTWYFVAAVADISNNIKRIYVFDPVGNQLASVSQSYSGSWGADAGDPSIGGENNLSSETGSRFHFVGSIDEVSVHDRALTVEQINDLRTVVHGCAISPVAEYRLDDCRWDGSVDEVVDSSGNNNHGVAFYDAETIANDGTGGICRAGFFDGSEDYVEIPNTPVMNPVGAFTASVWFRADSFGSWNGVISKLTNVNSGTGRGWNIQVGRSQRIASLMADSSGHYRYLKSTTVPQVGAWYHVVLVHQVDNTNRLYVNGVQEAVNNHAIAFASNPFQIGKFYTDSSGLFFDGAIDEVELYDDALDASQVHSLYLNQLTQNNYDGSPRFCPCAASAAYHFDVCSETDTIIDDSGNGFDGRVQNGPLAIELGKVCNGGRFDGIDDYIEIDDSDKFDNTDALTIAGWINPEDIRISPPTGNARGIISKRNTFSSNVAYGVFFYSARGDGKIYVDLDTVNNRFASNTIIPENSWTHFAVVFDGTLPASQRAKLYINGVLDKVAPESSSSIPDYNSNLYLGNLYTGLSQLKVYKGLMDEIRILPEALSAADIQALYQETRSGCQICGMLDHYRIEHTGVGLTCQRSDITLRACSDASCSSEYSDPVTITMTPATANPPVWISGDNYTFTGHETVQLRQTVTGLATLGLRDPNPIPVHDYKCFNSGIEGDCGLVFYDSGFIYDVPDLTSCQDSPQIVLHAVRTDDTTKTCVADDGFANTTKTVHFWNSYISPGTGTETLVLDGIDIASASPGTGIPLNFDANATANFMLNYPDAGQLQLNAHYDGIGSEEAGLVMAGTDSFVVRPVGLCIYSDEANADCAAGNGLCSAFKRVDENFTLKVKGVCWENSGDSDFCSGNVTTPNFQLDAISISHNLIAPTGAGVSTGIIGVTAVDISAADSGEAVIAHQTVSEVGVFNFAATSPAYFGQALPVATSTNIGRFIPDHFTTSIINDGVFEDGCSGFTYSGQPFTYSFPNFPELLITATGGGGNTVVNYRDDFVKLTQSTQINMPAVTADASHVGSNGSLLALIWTPGVSTLVTNNDGTLNFTLGVDEFIYTREANALAPPFISDVQLPVTAITDSDGVSAAGLPISFVPTGTPIRYGRMQLQNSYGPETLPLTIPLLTEYYDGFAFVPNVLDSCTPYDSLHLTLTNYQGNLDAGETLATGSGTLLSGTGHDLTLSGPGTGNDGSVDVMLDLSLTTGAGLEWLQPAGSNPSAKATFGIFKGNTHLIYMRESVW